MYVEANPRFRTLNIKDELGNTVMREKVQKKDTIQTQKLDQALSKDKTQSQKAGKGKGLKVQSTDNTFGLYFKLKDIYLSSNKLKSWKNSQK